MIKFNELPKIMQTKEVKPYYEIIKKRWLSLAIIRAVDIILAVITLIITSPIFLILSITIKLTDKGSIFFKQTRITRYCKKFTILKFRTMVTNAEKIGPSNTVKDDNRITKIGKFMRKTKLDELPQLLNVIKGDMSFVGARPLVEKHVAGYTPEMYATLLTRAGITSLASIAYKDEESLLEDCPDIDKTYIEKVLPPKMKINIDNINRFSVRHNIYVMLYTFTSVFFKHDKK